MAYMSWNFFMYLSQAILCCRRLCGLLATILLIEYPMILVLI